jgi:hypothetical protein
MSYFLESAFYGIGLSLAYYFFCLLGSPLRSEKGTFFAANLFSSFYLGSLVFYWFVLILSGYFQLHLGWAFVSYGLLAIGSFSWFRPQTLKAHLKSIALFSLVFLLLAWTMNGLSEYFDYFVHWGYVLKKIIVDGRLPHHSSIYEYSMWNYPEMNAVWALPAQMVFDTEMFVRYRNIPLLVGLVALLYWLSKEKINQKIVLAGGLAVFGILVAQWFPVLLPKTYFTAYADLPFTLVLLSVGILILRFQLAKNLEYLVLACICLAVLSQTRFDGIFLYPIHFLIGIYLLKNRRQLTTWQILFVLMSLLTPWLWIVYHKWIGNIHGSFEKLDLLTGILRYPRVIKQVLREYPLGWVVTVFNLIVLWRLKSKTAWLSNLTIYSFIVLYLGGMFFVASAEWGYIIETQRYCSRVNPLFILLLGLNCLSLFEKYPWGASKIERLKNHLKGIWSLVERHRWVLSTLGLVLAISSSQLSAQSRIKKLPANVSVCAEALLKSGETPPKILYFILDDGKQPGLTLDGYFEARHFFYPQRVEGVHRKDLTPEIDWHVDDGQNRIRINGREQPCDPNKG